MSSFTRCQEVEQAALKEFRDHFRRVNSLCRHNIFDFHVPSRSKAEQEVYGDVDFYHLTDNTLSHIEVKAEERNAHDNLFLEVWSNLPCKTPGWMHHYPKVDFLWYYFLNTREFYSCEMQELKHWAFTLNRMEPFKLKKQKKNDQLNETWGHCVPIVVLKNDLKTFRVRTLPTEIVIPQPSETNTYQSLSTPPCQHLIAAA